MEVRDMLSLMKNKSTPKKDNKKSGNILNLNEDVRNSLKKMRNYKINEAKFKTLDLDVKREEENFLNFFDDLNVMVDFIELEVYDEGVFWGGTIDGVIQFVYLITPSEVDSGYEIYYLDDFNKENPDNIEISKRIEMYYDDFRKFWSENLLQQYT